MLYIFSVVNFVFFIERGQLKPMPRLLQARRLRLLIGVQPCFSVLPIHNSDCQSWGRVVYNHIDPETLTTAIVDYVVHIDYCLWEQEGSSVTARKDLIINRIEPVRYPKGFDNNESIFGYNKVL